MIPQNCDPNYLTIFIKFEENIKFRMRKSSCIGQLRQTFCQGHKMKLKSVRFLIDGKRITDQETTDSLNLKDGDIIEAFQEMVGGGLPKKKNIADDLDRILEELGNGNDKDLDSDSSSDESNFDKMDHQVPNIHEDVEDVSV